MGLIKEAVRRLLPRGIKKHRILTGRLRGMHIVTSWHDYPAAITGRTERPLLEWFDENVRAGETWLDVGAHYGYTALALSRLVGPTGRVVAFEPVLQTAGCLARTRLINDLSQLTVVSMGLAAPEELELRLLPLIRGMADTTLVQRPATVAGSEAIILAQLDWLWPHVSGGRSEIHGIKIDVQGMEVEALQGMSRILRMSRPKVVVELHNGVERSAVLAILASCGYESSGKPLEPIPGELKAQYVDDRSYAFSAAPY